MENINDRHLLDQLLDLLNQALDQADGRREDQDFTLLKKIRQKEYKGHNNDVDMYCEGRLAYLYARHCRNYTKLEDYIGKEINLDN
jgi:hypothetical protein